MFRLLFIYAVAAASCLAGCSINPPRPKPSTPANELPRPESDLSAAISVDLASVFAQVNDAIPSRFSEQWPNGWVETPGNDRLKYRYNAWRDPLGLLLEQGTVKVTANAHYEGCGGYDLPLAPIVVGCCGNDPPGDGPRGIQAKLDLGASLTSDWHISPSASITSVQGTNKCEVTAGNINVTSVVEGVVRNVLQSNLGRINGAVASIDVKPSATRLWELVQKPIAVGDSTWLVINPSSVAIGPLVGDGTVARTTFGIHAKPQVIVGSQPAAPTTVPLPALSPNAGDGKFYLALEGRLAHAKANELMRTQAVGRRIYRAGKYIEITDMRVYGTGGGAAVLEVAFKGDARGRMFLVGKPLYDAGTGELTVTELDYDFDTKNVLLKAADWLAHEEVLETLRSYAHWSMREPIEQARSQLNAVLVLDPSPGVHVKGHVDVVQGSSVLVTSKGVVVRGIVQGALDIKVDAGALQ